jgi:hypothetical protein
VLNKSSTLAAALNLMMCVPPIVIVLPIFGFLPVCAALVVTVN